jgi:acetyl-CoA C-acetyltransferase
VVSDPRVPVIVGVGAVDQRFEDPADGVEAVDLMVRAVEVALADAGGSATVASLRNRIAWIGVPEGTWGYTDAGRLVAERLGLAHPDQVHTVQADVGVVQQDLLTAAAQRIASGELDVAVVVGGEAKYRQRRGSITSEPATETVQPEGTAPDERWRPATMAVLDLEIVRNTVTPVAAYALIERALGHARGEPEDQHRDRVADLWATFAAVAAANPRAWDRTGPTAAEIRDAGPGNRMISFPYTKRLSAQWNVDQAAAIVLCSASVSGEVGVARDRWVFPHASTVSNHARSVTQRREIHRSPGAEVAAPRVLELAGIGADQLGPADLYSCFPVAVELLGAALGLPLDDPGRPLTVTGGLTFAGGPLNNYVLQAMVPLIEQLREDPSRPGLSSSVSGFLVKQAFSVWQAAPPTDAYRHEDVTVAVAEVADEVEVVDTTVAGALVTGTVATATVDIADGQPSRAVALVDLPDGTRTIANTVDPAIGLAFMAADPIGLAVAIGPDGTFVAAD